MDWLAGWLIFVKFNDKLERITKSLGKKYKYRVLSSYHSDPLTTLIPERSSLDLTDIAI